MIILREVAIAATLCTLTFAAAAAPGFASAPDDKPVVLTAPAAERAATADPVLPNPRVEDVADTRLSQPGDQAERPDYSTLAAAVAAQSLPEQMDEELRCLAGAVYFEAKGEPLAGQLAVAHVILNRTESGRFPGSICGVVKQPGQFSFVRGGSMPQIGQNQAYRTAIAVARVAMADDWDDPVDGALYFHAARVAPNWGKRRVAAIGNHIFYR